MRHLRLTIIPLVLLLTVFFNIERLGISAINALDMDSFVYVLGATVVIVIIVIPLFQEVSTQTLILWSIALYIVGKIFVFNDKPLWGDSYTYLSITAVTFLSLSTWLAHRFARALRDFEKAVEGIVGDDVSHCVQPLDEASNIVQTYMRFSRRSQSPLSVIMVEPEPESLQATLTRALQEAHKAILKRYVFLMLIRTFNQTLRRTDLMMEQRKKGRLVILCPETSPVGSAMLTARIQAAIARQHNVSVRCSSASFPDEALTFEELIHTAEGRLMQREQLPTFSEGISVQ